MGASPDRDRDEPGTVGSGHRRGRGARALLSMLVLVLPAAGMTVGAAGAPVLAHTWQPEFSVTARPQEGAAGTQVTVSFLSLGYPDIVITSCSASFPDQEQAPCDVSGKVASVGLTVPKDAPAGPTSISWGLAYKDIADDVDVVVGDANGAVDFTVLPPSGPAPRFVVVARPQRAKPGAPVTVSFSAPDQPVVITSCTARFRDGSAAGCVRSDGTWSASLTVPAGARDGPTSIAWDLTYRPIDDAVGATGNANGSVAFTVLPPSGPAPTTPQFSVVARPQEAAAGAAVSVTFTAPNPAVAIIRCFAAFRGGARTTCGTPGGVHTAGLRVPGNARAGPAFVDWGLSYEILSDGVVTGAGSTRGSIGFTVLPPSGPGPGAPQFSVAVRPHEGAPGTAVTVSFAAADPGVSITSCTARFPDGGAAGCTRSGRAWSAALTVPAGAAAGSTSIAWGLSYRQANTAGRGDANGTASFTVLPPPALTEATRTRYLPYVLPLVGLALLGVFAVLFLRGRPSRPSRHDRRAPAAPEVRALLRADRPPAVTVSGDDPRSTHSVRLEPHHAAVSASIDEAHP